MRHDAIIVEMLPDGRRLHLRDGPIDLVIEARGAAAEVAAAYATAKRVFPAILPALMSEIGTLRAPLGAGQACGPVARAMVQAATCVARGTFATPMIAVAGAVADHMLRALLEGRNLESAYVNNGGDIALHLSEGQHFDVGICTDPLTGGIASKARLTVADGVGGIATSGWRGRSLSLGIADAVTVLAGDAATADAAATLIANAVDLPDHPAIQRMRANDLAPDSDLGDRLVTTDVTTLTRSDRQDALDRGALRARDLVARGMIVAAHACLQGDRFVCGGPRSAIDPTARPASHVARKEVPVHA